MKKKQWRFLLTEILEARNEANTQHAYIENRIAEAQVQLDAILAKLEVMQTDLEDDHICVTSQIDALPVAESLINWRPHDHEAENYADLRTYIVNADGTRTECDPDPAPLPPGTRLHTYVLQEDGTTREAIP